MADQNSKARNSYEFFLSHGNYRAIKLNILRTVTKIAFYKISWRIVLPAFQWFSRWLVKAIGAAGPNWNKSPHRSHDTYSRGQKWQLKIFTGFKMFSINQWEFIRTCESFQYKLPALGAANKLYKVQIMTSPIAISVATRRLAGERKDCLFNSKNSTQHVFTSRYWSESQSYVTG